MTKVCVKKELCLWGQKRRKANEMQDKKETQKARERRNVTILQLTNSIITPTERNQRILTQNKTPSFISIILQEQLNPLSSPKQSGERPLHATEEKDVLGTLSPFLYLTCSFVALTATSPSVSQRQDLSSKAIE